MDFIYYTKRLENMIVQLVLLGYFLQQHSIRHFSKNESREHCCRQQFYACLGDLSFSLLIEHGKASPTDTTKFAGMPSY